MQINQKKLARQLSIIDKWIANGCRGTLEAVTGFGKTYVAILAIQRFRKKYPEHQIDVVLPKIPLYEDWTDPIRGHIAKHNLQYVKAFVVNTYVKNERRFPAILILDEIHNYASDEFGKVFDIAGVLPIEDIQRGTPPYVLGLTATLERQDGKHTFIEKFAPIIDTVTLEEAKREGYISKFKIYNWGLDLSDEDQRDYDIIDNTFRTSFAKFNHNFQLAQSCGFGKDTVSVLEIPVAYNIVIDGVNKTIYKNELVAKTSSQWCNWFAKENGWNGEEDHEWTPKRVSEIAQHFRNSMTQRKTFIYTAKIKIDAIEELVNKYPKVKTITFGESNKFADSIAERLGDKCRAYHSDIKGIDVRVETLDKKGKLVYKNKRIGKDRYKASIIQDFMTLPDFTILATTKAVDEGLDYDKVRIGVQASYTSTKRQDTQRTGRTVRKDENDASKMAVVVNLYIKNTQEEKWLKDKQRGIEGVEWVDSVEDINFEEFIEEEISLV